MSLVVSRILLRYLSGAMLAYGLLPPEMADQIAADPDLVAALGAALAVLTEGVYAVAKKRGWTT